MVRRSLHASPAEETKLMSQRPDTIMLIHGLWMTPRSWEHWVERYKGHGFDVLAPAYPGLEVEVEALREDPSPIEVLTIEGVVHHYETIIRGLKRPPILMGHSFGGALVQILLDRGLGAAGVAIDSAPIKGILKVPWTQVRSTWPVLKNPQNRHRAVPFTLEQFRYAFTNNLSEEESRAAYERYHIPAPGRIVFNGATQNFSPQAATRVDFEKEDRAPLLFIAGGEDHIMPASLNQANYEHYRSGIVAFREYPDRAHFTAGQQGWEAVADFALEWAFHPVAGTLDWPARRAS
jgi:pimeloyl-ACP methyl ester carboxylesterase